MRKNYWRLLSRFDRIDDPWLLSFLQQESYTPFVAEYIGNYFLEKIKADLDEVPFYFTIRWSQPIEDQNMLVRGNPKFFLIKDLEKEELVEMPLEIVSNHKGTFRFQVILPKEYMTKKQITILITAEDHTETHVEVFNINIHAENHANHTNHSLNLAA